MAVMKSDLEQLLARCQRFSELSGLSESTVSRKVFNDGKKLRAIREGRCKRVFNETLQAANVKLDALEEELSQSSGAVASD